MRISAVKKGTAKQTNKPTYRCALYSCCWLSNKTSIINANVIQRHACEFCVAKGEFYKFK